jgi:hypothetical protein
MIFQNENDTLTKYSNITPLIMHTDIQSRCPASISPIVTKILAVNVVAMMGIFGHRLQNVILLASCTVDPRARNESSSGRP